MQHKVRFVGIQTKMNMIIWNWPIKFLIGGGAVLAAFAVGIGIIIGHFGINKSQSSSPGKYEYLTRQADENNFRKFIDSIQADKIEANLK